MARIPLIDPDDASPEVQAVYERMGGDSTLLNVMKLFGNHAGFLGGVAQLLNSLYSDAELAPRYRELAWLRTSQLNGCHY